MGHTVTVNDPHGALDASAAYDFVDLFYRGPDARFVVVVGRVDPRNATMRGGHRMLPDGTHVISLYVGPIGDAVRLHVPCGGNTTIPCDLATGMFLTFAHELQHANQCLSHMMETGDAFRHGRYRGRPNEVEARRFVDDNVDAIVDFVAG